MDTAVWTPRARHVYDAILTRVATKATYAQASLWGVTVEPGCLFFGRPLFRKGARARIHIGQGCMLRSARWSNVVGVDRPCMLSAVTDGSLVELGAGCGLTSTVIAAVQSVRLGRNVLCGSNVTITDSDWHDLESTGREFPGRVAAVEIEDDVWLGAHTLVLKGVTIGRGTVVGAGSVVTDSLPAGVLAAGSPAAPVKSLRPPSDS